MKSTLSFGLHAFLALILVLLWAVPSLGMAKIKKEKDEEPLRIVIEGVDEILRKQIELSLSLAQLAGEHPTQARLQRLYARAPQEIRQALRPFGYYDVNVSSRMKRKGQLFVYRFHVEPGPRVHMDRIRIDIKEAGEQDVQLLKARAAFPLKPGDPLVHAKYDQGKEALLDAAIQEGYLDAAYTTSRLEVDPARRLANVILELRTGQRYRLGRVNIEQTILKPSFVRKYIPFQEGEPYQTRKLLDLKYALDDSGYFSSVTVAPERKKTQDDMVPITVTTNPAKRNLYTAGLGFGTDSGPRGSLGWQNRYLNKKGHTLRIDGATSLIDSHLTADYRVPVPPPATDSLSFNGGMQQQDVDDRKSLKGTAGIGLMRSSGSWQRSLRINYEYERYRIGDQEQEHAILLLPGLGWSYTKSDQAPIMRQGLRIDTDVRGAAKWLASDLDFLRLYARAKWIQGLWPGGRVLLRGESGANLTSKLVQVPLSQRFFAGGDQSVRGFDYQKLGPKDSDGNVIGGRYLMVGSTEFEQGVWNKLGVATFFDMGNAFNTFSEPMKKAMGAGLRFHTPVGVARLDIARTIETRPSWRVHITFGPDL
jgi:translocation and assembly module TamA